MTIITRERQQSGVAAAAPTLVCRTSWSGWRTASITRTRDTGPAGGDGVPLVLLQHFAETSKNWDPALIDALSSARRAITFDDAGVGGSTGRHRTLWSRWHTTDRLYRRLDLGQVDLLVSPSGSFVAQQIA